MTAELNESLERAINELVVIENYNDEWPNLYSREKDALVEHFPHLTRIEHIGSTAVPGLSAKPIIDIMIGVAHLEEADALLAHLLELGYDTSLEFNAGLIDRRWLMKHASGRRTHHLHLVIVGSDTWTRYLKFRDRLREDPLLRSHYQDLKEALAKYCREDRERYTTLKSEFVDTALS